MQCPNCGHENEAGAKFCSQCGTSLRITCPVCSTEQGIDARFCSNCGAALQADSAGATGDLARYVPEELLTKIRSARSGNAMRGERRTVTMLFADIQGSTAAAEHLDPEDWADIINGAFEHLIAPVYRYEGTLARLQGDAVLAFFGAPIAHEDDPVRAVRAGLEIVEAIEPYQQQVLERWNVPIAIRVGINTGLVVVGEVGSDLRVEYTALGDAINVAARMEQTADPGTVRITGDTMGLVAEDFEFDELGPVEVKGKSEPVAAYRVLRMARPAHPHRLERPLVGRAEELRILDEFRARLVDGSGSIASIIGEAGVGKSRLLDEMRSSSAESIPLAFAHSADGRASWMYGSSRSYDASIPYSTIRDLLRRWWALDGADDPFGRIAAATEAVGLGSQADAEAYLGHVAGVELPGDLAAIVDSLDPPALNGRVAEAVPAYLEAEAARRPLMVTLEDLHWADPMSLVLVESIMEVTEHAPLGLVFTMRPYRDEPTWHIHEVAGRDHPHRYQPLDLTSLGDDATIELLDELLEDRAISEATRERIVARADGNPLFVEEMVRSLRDESDESTPDSLVPRNLAGMLTARLDRLDDESKLVAQMASVFGSEFDRAVLAAVLDGGTDVSKRVTDLLRRGIFVEGAQRSAMQFRHALMQEAAYSTILRKTRRELHHRVADVLIGSDAGSVQEIARHLVEADDPDAAFPYFIEAGSLAIRSMALADAIRFFTMALDNIPDDADSELVVTAHDGLGEAHSLVPDLSQSASAYQRLYEYGEHTAHPSAQVKALNRLAVATAAIGGDLPKAMDYLEDAKRIATENGDQSGLTEYHMNACFVTSLGGQIDEAVVHDEETVRLAEHQGADGVRLEGMARRADNYMSLLDFERGIPALEDALRVAEEAGADQAVAVLQVAGVGALRLREGDFRGALEAIIPAEETLARYASFYTGLAQTQAAMCLRELGDLEAALGRLVDARRIADRTHYSFYISMAAAAMAYVYAEAGVLEPIAGLRATAVEAVESPLGEYMGSTVWADLGYAGLLSDELGTAAEDFGRGLEASSATRFWERPRLLVGSALCSVSLGDLAGAGERLAEARAYVGEKDLRTYDALIGYADGQLLSAEERADDAEAALARAHAAALDNGQRLLIIRIEEARSRLAAGAGDLEVAGQHASNARSVVETIAQSMVDVDLRDSFVAKWTARLGEHAAEA